METGPAGGQHPRAALDDGSLRLLCRRPHGEGQNRPKPGWWKQYGLPDDHIFALETGASRVSVFEIQLVPGLLQTADHAWAVFESRRQPMPKEEIANQLSMRLTRQDRLPDEDFPLELVAGLDEYLLRRPVDGSTVMRAQLRHLALVAELPAMNVHVLPTSSICNESYHGRFDLLDFPDHQQLSMIYVNHALSHFHPGQDVLVGKASC